jgi:acetyl coenzyme A synthetase (ADP forming)-like protein
VSGSAVDLSGLLRPRSVAVIGASTERGSIGGEIFRNLLLNGFQGPVYPVNLKSDFVQSVKAYASVADIPGPVDLAVVVVPAKVVVATVEACAAKGVRGVVVISAGFKEVNEEGAAREARLKEIVRAHGMRLVGPNCLGVLSTAPDVRLDATFAPTYPPEGNVAIASQSGALGVAILDYTRSFNIGVSDFVSIGNKADVSSNDLVQWWDADPRTKVMLLYLESFGNPRKFTRLAREITRRKPIVAVKSGRTRRGMTAATSHTGALAGADVAVDALFAQTGIIRVDTVEELFDMAAFLAYQPIPKGSHVAILTNAGGPGILATDACEAHGLEVPDLSESTTARLHEFLPPEASVRNPVDMIASATAQNYERATRALLADPKIDALIALFVPPIVTEPREVARGIVNGSAGTEKPVLTCFLGKHGVPEGLRSLKEGNIPSYAFPESAVRVLGRAVRHGQWMAKAPGREIAFDDVSAAAAAAVFAAARERMGDEGGWLNADEVDRVLAAYGIRTPPVLFAATPKEAAAAARSLGFPVVVKLLSDSISHKSDVGGVRLDLRTEAEVESAGNEICATLRARGLEGAVRGFTVQPLVKEGVEVLVGVTQDPKFGPLVAFGLGGVQVEVMKDVTFRIHPLTDRDADEMVRGVRGYALLNGYRGAPPADVPALEEAILRVSVLVGNHPEIAEMDLNPVKVLSVGKGCVAVDARIRIGIRP